MPCSTATRNRSPSRTQVKRVPTTSTVASPHSICQRRGPPGTMSKLALPRSSTAMKVVADDSIGSKRAPADSSTRDPSDIIRRRPAVGASTATIGSPLARRSGPGSWRR
jgi:hypothetical protein